MRESVAKSTSLTLLYNKVWLVLKNETHVQFFVVCPEGFRQSEIVHGSFILSFP